MVAVPPASRRPRSPRFRFARLASVLAGAVLAAAGVTGCGGDGSADEALAGVVREPMLDVGTVELADAETGTPVAMRADPGELLVVYFGYTSCPDVCPTTMSDLSVALRDLPDDLADRVTVAFATVDPERDTADVLGGYLGHFFDGGMPLRTEDPDQLAAAASAFGVQYQVAEHGAGDRSYDVAHTAVTYVVDDAGTVVVEWPFGFAVEDISADLRALLDKEAA